MPTHMLMMSSAVTCMDPRVVPEQFLGPENPIVAVARNAGGRATPDVIRTINTVQSLAYKVGKVSVMVVHHTGTYRLALLGVSIGLPTL
jgi:carbonic anhydrase